MLYQSFIFLIIHLVIFAVYRLIFIQQFSQISDQYFLVWCYGLRLDLALLSCEMTLFFTLSFLIGRMKQRYFFCYQWTLLFFHTAFVIANIQFFKERNQQVGDSLVAYLTSPYEIYIAAYPVLKQNPILFSLGILFLISAYYAGIHWSRRWRENKWQLWWQWRAMLKMIGIILVCMIPCLDAVTVKEQKSSIGWEIKVVHSKFYAQLNHFMLNQAIINPCYEFFRVNVPESLRVQVPYNLSEEEALKINEKLLALPTLNESYPLAREIESPLEIGIENVVILQVEGLSQTILDKQEQGKYIMPHLHDMQLQGLYFPNGVQNFGATIGSFFATATSIHKACFDEKTRTLTTAEMNGYFCTLAQNLGSKDYHHVFGQAYRQNYNDFISFMGSQGYTSYSYYDFYDRLKNKNLLDSANDGMGIFDGYFLQESADILLQTPGKFTGHLVTVTSHSPWTIPPSYAQNFTYSSADLNAFAYTDQAIYDFIKRLEQDERWDKTIVVIVADHTSILCNDVWERIRIPIIFFGKPILRLPNKPTHLEQIYASHVDILPTVLYLMGGKRNYCGIGKNLLDPQATQMGALGASRSYGYYAKQNWLLQYSPFEKDTQLFQIKQGILVPQDQSELYPEICQQLLLEYLAQSELCRRLTARNQIVPNTK